MELFARHLKRRKAIVICPLLESLKINNFMLEYFFSCAITELVKEIKLRAIIVSQAMA